MNLKTLVASATVVLAACAPQTTPPETAAAALDTDAQKFSYAAGFEIGQRLQQMGEVDVDLTAMSAGLSDAYKGMEGRISAEEMNTVKQNVYKAAADKRNAEREAKAGANTAKGEKFLAENGKKDGVVTTDSGLQYEILEAGEGEAPAPTDTVVVHYTGTLIDGTEFDSSRSRGQPARFKLNGVIKGWTEGLQVLKPGGRAKLYIPADLAYGDRGAGQLIGPNETLIFDVELLEIAAAAAAKEE